MAQRSPLLGALHFEFAHRILQIAKLFLLHLNINLYKVLPISLQLKKFSRRLPIVIAVEVIVCQEKHVFYSRIVVHVLHKIIGIRNLEFAATKFIN